MIGGVAVVPIIYLMRGLPGSGKFTRAKELSARIGAEVVNRDALRMALLGSYWTGDHADEAKVSFYERSLVDDTLPAQAPSVRAGLAGDRATLLTVRLSL